jgi:hypothetical protein
VVFRGGSSPPPKIVKKYVFWRKIVIFHTKYPKNVRAYLLSAQFFQVPPPISWNSGSAPGIRGIPIFVELVDIVTMKFRIRLICVTMDTQTRIYTYNLGWTWFTCSYKHYIRHIDCNLYSYSVDVNPIIYISTEMYFFFKTSESCINEFKEILSICDIDIILQGNWKQM